MLPALAIAEALRARGVEVTFAGSPGRVEARLVADAGYPFDPFRVSGFPRRPGVRLLRAAVQAVSAPFACRAILELRRPDVVLGAGGYVAGPMVLAAWSKRIPAALTEADAHVGLANRLASPFAQRLFLAYPSGKERSVGRPIPSSSRVVPRDEARRELGLPLEGRVLLVAGALAGARSLNEAAVEAFGESGPGVLHLTGERDFELVRARVSRDDYVVLPSTERFGVALGAADLALARAGGSVWELAAAGLPAVFVPYPHATADHQTRNAEYFERAGGAVVVPDSELERALDVVRSLLADDAELAAMRKAMLGAARPDAAEEIAEELVQLAAAARR
ncbi:MAG: UDP-N-acetylglucosamine--N-acetylmuramyl-(pentapeptide) pyrophosphoryl-undecaprenol N-acetylglucosamine transferase [Actinobacteria bacterium]|nr:UDP-N-acetylglucosamine--N-acetylmuramyl-(pentapeptide) pyrophosphoryl-undecaprenol N-acetylglucosamine transferase [Actinomycetota bacterium]